MDCLVMIGWDVTGRVPDGLDDDELYEMCVSAGTVSGVMQELWFTRLDRGDGVKRVFLYASLIDDMDEWVGVESGESMYELAEAVLKQFGMEPSLPKVYIIPQ
jgi:hypothetical protein